MMQKVRTLLNKIDYFVFIQIIAFFVILSFQDDTIDENYSYALNNSLVTLAFFGVWVIELIKQLIIKKPTNLILTGTLLYIVFRTSWSSLVMFLKESGKKSWQPSVVGYVGTQFISILLMLSALNIGVYLYTINKDKKWIIFTIITACLASLWSLELYNYLLIDYK